MNKSFKAVLTATIMPEDGIYKVETIDIQLQSLNLKGVPHFCGHPTTKVLIEKSGAIHQPGLFSGLNAGDSALCVGLLKPRNGGSAAHNVETEVTADDLTLRVLTRIE